MTTASPPRTSQDPYRSVWIALALVIAAAVLGFAKSYLQGVTFSGLTFTTVVHVHGALTALWLVMLAGQAWLIRTRRRELHRWVGRSSYVVVPVILLMMIVVSHQGIHRTPEITAMDARLQTFNVFSFLGFGLSWALAIGYRRRISLHLRFMVSTVLGMGSAIVLRILLNWFAWVPGLSLADDPNNIENAILANGAILTLALLGLIALDRRLGIHRSPYRVVTTTTLLLHVGFFTFAKSEWWTALVEGFAGLPL